MCKYIKYIGFICCLLTIYSGDAVAAADSCVAAGRYAGELCALQDSSSVQPAGVVYDPLCREPNPDCRIVQGYEFCVCVPNPGEYCFEESKSYLSTWQAVGPGIMRTQKWTSNGGNKCEQSTTEYIYACWRGFYGSPVSGDPSQCQPCPNSGTSHAPAPDSPIMAYNNITNFDMGGCYIENGEDEFGKYVFDGQCHYK